jgi:hypothetical protein
LNWRKKRKEKGESEKSGKRREEERMAREKVMPGTVSRIA